MGYGERENNGKAEEREDNLSKAAGTESHLISSENTLLFSFILIMTFQQKREERERDVSDDAQ